MTFLEAALQILGREGKALHFKELTEKAVNNKLLTFVGRTPEVTMQTQLTAAVKKAPGNPFVRVKPGVFGLLRYPEIVEPEPQAPPPPTPTPEPAATASSEGGAAESGRARRPRRGRQGRGDADSRETATLPAVQLPEDRVEAEAREGGDLPGEPSTREPFSRETFTGERSTGERSTGEPSTREPFSRETFTGERSTGEPSTRQPSAPDFSRAEAIAAAPMPAPQDETDSASESGEGDDEEEGELAAGEAGTADGEAGARRRRRRRRRRRGGPVDANGMAIETGALPNDGMMPMETEPVSAAPNPEANEPAEESSEDSSSSAAGPTTATGDESQVRRIMAPIDAAIEVLRGQTPGRGVHVRQIADTAVRRRLVHGEAHEAWRVVRAALAAEPKERLRAGLRPRIRAAGSGLFALARRPADMDLEKAEFVYGEAVRALRERTLASLEQRLGELASGAFEALARVLLQREGFGPATFVKRVEGTVYLEALRGRGWKPSKCLVALRWGPSPAGRRAVGELRAGVRARNADEGVILLAGRLAEEAIREWKQPGPPIEVVDGPAVAEACARHGVGVITAQVSVDFVDADFFSELSEG